MPIQKIAPCLWFDGQAEEAAKFYTSVFKNSRITATARYGETGQEVTGAKPGSVMTVAFEIDGHPFTALNGGPHFKFNEAISFEVFCDTQKDVDYYWEKLGAGGDPKAQQCGWLKDKFGVSWQVIPKELPDLLMDSKSANGQRAMAAMLKMKKLDIDEVKRAYAG
jgi:predicted 3-demethylubiquinone-9 3-methyltransferase (glyoxalase superfamily)